jgi:hypothetical protein
VRSSGAALAGLQLCRGEGFQRWAHGPEERGREVDPSGAVGLGEHPVHVRLDARL